MICSVCGQDYGVAHNCAGVAAFMTPEEAAPPPSSFDPIYYLRLAFDIARWDDVAIRRASRDSNAIGYGMVVWTVSAFLILLGTTIPLLLARTEIPAPALLLALIPGLGMGLAIMATVTLLQLGLSHLIAKWLLGGKGTYLELMRPLLLGWCVNGPLRESAGKYPQSDVALATLPMLGATQVHAGILLAIAASLAAWFLLYRTAEGLRLRATGFNANAARWAGVNVMAQIARAMAISGAMAGLAGGIELLGVTHRLFERFAAGYGYAGIAVALLAQLHPLGTLASAFFFGALTTGAGELQRTAGISSTVATFGQAIVILAMIALTRRRNR